jgi:prevent-host-death family protein
LAGEHVFVYSNNEKGNIAELAVAAAAARLGISVLKPMTEHEVYDLAFDLGSRILRVQCKWANVDGAVVSVYVGRCRTRRRGYVRSTYEVDEIDAVAAYCLDLDRCFILPSAMVAGKHQLHLRLAAEAKNNQRGGVNWAVDFDLGAVAQLGEHLDGIEGVGGSSPPSSIPSSPADAADAEVVGAHIFRNHFGWYMQRASAGERFLVTRHGRPFARLSPPDSQLSL